LVETTTEAVGQTHQWLPSLPSPLTNSLHCEAAEAELRPPLSKALWDRNSPRSLLAGGAPGRTFRSLPFRPQRRLIYTTNAMDSVHACLRKIIKTRGHFSSGNAATKLIWLVS
jgi:putative transposase